VFFLVCKKKKRVINIQARCLGELETRSTPESPLPCDIIPGAKTKVGQEFKICSKNDKSRMVREGSRALPNPQADSRGNVVYAVAYLEQMTQHYPEVSELLERFRKVAPQLPGKIPSELAFFTRMFSAWKTNPPRRKSDA
jgi:hypothetical protein